MFKILPQQSRYPFLVFRGIDGKPLAVRVSSILAVYADEEIDRAADPEPFFKSVMMNRINVYREAHTKTDASPFCVLQVQDAGHITVQASFEDVMMRIAAAEGGVHDQTTH